MADPPPGYGPTEDFLNWFRAVYSLIHERFRAAAYSITRDWDEAENLCQEAVLRFLRLWTAKWVRDPDPVIASFQLLAGLLRCVSYLWQGDMRRLSRTPKHSPLPADVLVVHEEPDEALGRAELVQLVAFCLDNLSARNRDVLRLNYFEGLCTVEIAGRMGITVDAVRAQLTRARQEFRVKFGDVIGRFVDLPPDDVDN